MVSGTGWRGIAELFRFVWSALVLLLLGKLLGPVAFGLVGMTDVLVLFFNIFMEMGFETAVVQQRKLNDQSLSSLFWLNISLGLLLAVVGLLISPLLAVFYQEARVQLIFSVLCLTFILQSFSIIQRGLLIRQMDFRALAVIDMLSSLLASFLAIGVALQGGSYWSLVVLQLGRHLFTAVGYWYHSSWRPRLVFDLTDSLASIKFSGNVLLFNILNFVATRSDLILIGRLLGTEALGFYVMAQRLVFAPLGQILNIISATLLPVLAAVQHNPAQVGRLYTKVMSTVFTAVAPFFVLVILLASVLVPFQLGVEWLPLVPLLIIWSLGGLRRILSTRMGVLFLAMNRPDLQWKYQLVSTPIVTAVLLFSARWGVVGISINYNLAQLFTSILGVYLAFRLVNLNLGHYLKAYQFASLALLAQLGVGAGLLYLLRPFNWHPYLLTAVVTAVGLSLYATAVYLLDPQARQLWGDGRLWLSQKIGISQQNR